RALDSELRCELDVYSAGSGQCDRSGIEPRDAGDFHRVRVVDDASAGRKRIGRGVDAGVFFESGIRAAGDAASAVLLRSVGLDQRHQSGAQRLSARWRDLIAVESAHRIKAGAAAGIDRLTRGIADYAAGDRNQRNPAAAGRRIRYGQVDLIDTWISGGALIQNLRGNSTDVDRKRRVDAVRVRAENGVAVVRIRTQPGGPEHDRLARGS